MHVWYAVLYLSSAELKDVLSAPAMTEATPGSPPNGCSFILPLRWSHDSCLPSTATLNMHVVNQIVNQSFTLCDQEQYDHWLPLEKMLSVFSSSRNPYQNTPRLLLSDFSMSQSTVFVKALYIWTMNVVHIIIDIFVIHLDT